MKYLIKNKKASILPVTIIAMFIMMIVAFACIKMFLSQNIVVTADQVKLRTLYAADSIAEKQKMRLYSRIKERFYGNNNIGIGRDTQLTDSGIANVVGIEETNNNTFAFTSLSDEEKNKFLFHASGNNGLLDKANDDDIISGKPFFVNSAGIGSDSLREILIKPDILSNGVDVYSANLPTDAYIDGGVYFYKVNNVDVNTATLYPSSGVMEINEEVYPNIGDADPRTLENKRLGETFWEDLGNEYITVIVQTNPVNSFGLSDPVQGAILFRKNGSVLPTQAEIISALNSRYPNGVTPTGGGVTIGVYRTKYMVNNTRKNYVLISEASSKAINNKIPAVKSRVKIFFDLFMTKLVAAYYRYESMHRWFTWNSTAKTWAQHASGSNGGYNSFAGYKVIPDPSKTISNIKFHIQKWEEEVVS